MAAKVAWNDPLFSKIKHDDGISRYDYVTPVVFGSDVAPRDIMFSFCAVCEQACVLKGECVCVNGVLWKYFIINHSCAVCICVNYVCFIKEKYCDVRKKYII